MDSTPQSGATTPARQPVSLLGATLLAATLCAIGFHIVRFMHAGGLWRDEANSLQTATAPTWQRFWDIWPYESFPMTWLALLRGWCMLPGGDSDSGLRLLGMFTGIAVVAALWLNAKWMGYRLPVISLPLVALNPTLIVYGDSLRGYGLGIVLEILLFGLLWRLAQQPTRRNFLAAAVVAVLSVHCLYNHAVTLLALAVAIAAVCAARRAWRSFAGVLLVGVIAAVSVIPLAIVITRGIAVRQAVRLPFSITRYLDMLAVTFNAQHAWIAAMVLILVIAAIVITVRRARRHESTDLAAAALLAAVLCTVATYIFFRQLQMTTLTWYYINLIAIIGIALDAAIAPALRTATGDRIKAAFVVAVIALTCFGGISQLTHRLTNIDVIAADLERNAQSGDYIITMPYAIGITFHRYYDGAAHWDTLPPLDDPSVNRLDAVRRRMAEREPLREVFDRAEQTLRNGGRVWLVRMNEQWPADQPPLVLAPAPHSPAKWFVGAYDTAWASQVDVYLRDRAALFVTLGQPDLGYVIGYENALVGLAEGHQPAPP